MNIEPEDIDEAFDNLLNEFLESSPELQFGELRAQRRLARFGTPRSTDPALEYWVIDVDSKHSMWLNIVGRKFDGGVARVLMCAVLPLGVDPEIGTGASVQFNFDTSVKYTSQMGKINGLVFGHSLIVFAGHRAGGTASRADLLEGIRAANPSIFNHLRPFLQTNRRKQDGWNWIRLGSSLDLAALLWHVFLYTFAVEQFKRGRRGEALLPEPSLDNTPIEFEIEEDEGGTFFRVEPSELNWTQLFYLESLNFRSELDYLFLYTGDIMDAEYTTPEEIEGQLRLRGERYLRLKPTAESEIVDGDEELDFDGLLERQALVTQRVGQTSFRAALLNAYGARCAVTGTSVEHVLEAAHIVPYRKGGAARHSVTNGLLMRADIHKLFDANRLRIDPDTLSIELDADLQASKVYGKLHGRALKVVPTKSAWKPSRRNLRRRNAFFLEN